jgi:ABC-type antimicrobial peptide transport system permease subunit
MLTMEERLGRQLVAPRFNMLLVAMFAVIALTLSAAGIYAVTAYAVTLRAREFGIRMALGAESLHVLRGVLLDVVKLIAAGLLLGGAGAFFFTRLLRGIVYDVAPADPLAVTGTVLLLALAGVAAALAPALRASRTDPGTVLRGD